VQEIDHFRRFPTGGTSYVTDPKPHPPVTESSWFRRVPNGGTVNRPPSRTGIFTTSDVAPRLIAAPPERPNGGGTIYRPSNADASGDEGGSGGENGDK
jgi:hypothetical protein